MTATEIRRLTSYARGGGCACKIPPGRLESAVSRLLGAGVHEPAGDLLVGLDDGDDAAEVLRGEHLLTVR